MLPTKFLLLWKVSVFEIPLDKELIVKCLLETCTKLKELILATMVLCGLIRVPGPSWFAAVPVTV